MDILSTFRTALDVLNERVTQLVVRAHLAMCAKCLAVSIGKSSRGQLKHDGDLRESKSCSQAVEKASSEIKSPYPANRRSSGLSTQCRENPLKELCK